MQIEIIVVFALAGASLLASLFAFWKFGDLKSYGLNLLKTDLEALAREVEPLRPWRNVLHGTDKVKKKEFLERYKARIDEAISQVMRERNVALVGLIKRSVVLTLMAVAGSQFSLLLLVLWSDAGLELFTTQNWPAFFSAANDTTLVLKENVLLGAFGDIYDDLFAQQELRFSEPTVAIYALLTRWLVEGTVPVLGIFVPRAIIGVHHLTSEVLEEMKVLQKMTAEGIGEFLIESGYQCREERGNDFVFHQD